jgi:hypothetical protein
MLNSNVQHLRRRLERVNIVADNYFESHQSIPEGVTKLILGVPRRRRQDAFLENAHCIN